MVEYILLPRDELRRGSTGFVEFVPQDNPHRRPGVMILCEIIDVSDSRSRIEIVAVCGDRSRLWMDSEKIFKKSVR